jgi:hypothetical protein
LDSAIFDAKNAIIEDEPTQLATWLRLLNIAIQSKLETIAFGILEGVSSLAYSEKISKNVMFNFNGN